MKQYHKYLLALGLVLLWAGFSLLYRGVEDGSSGLSLLGWIQIAFLIPGMVLISIMKGTHSNADWPAMAIFSLCVYGIIAMAVVKSLSMIARFNKRAGTH